PTLLEWREEVLRCVFDLEPDKKLLDANRVYYREHIADGTHVAIIAENDGEQCGCGGVCFSDELPSPDNPTGRCGYIMNVYVRPVFRRQGIAYKIVSRLIEEAKNHDCIKIYLESTHDGRPVYASSGFKEMNDMMKYDPNYEND
ncbi:MAG: GNAT family N-acetyltransferase, partial [Duncaniella sp.]|nr:GNAT family N-acetyltransferase [Duncaniella sp.]